MQAPGSLDLTMYQGASFDYTLTVKVNNVLLDLTGYTARMQVRKNHAGRDALISLTTENGGITLGGAAGTIEIGATPVQTAAVVAGEHVYDLELVDPSGSVDRLVQGLFTVDPEVTR